ncbi:hypothetical protein EYF80_012929 [Liparis tanakae]|uniref:Uncharacterized protein n=1 Tax=Liparis tanakae TaxID=230148 RepID=A0A4Z2IFX1_9TELE|nr:hypothetical protein EYF80_012929 [Liparis tanakae]
MSTAIRQPAGEQAGVSGRLLFRGSRDALQPLLFMVRAHSRPSSSLCLPSSPESEVKTRALVPETNMADVCQSASQSVDFTHAVKFRLLQERRGYCDSAPRSDSQGQRSRSHLYRDSGWRGRLPPPPTSRIGVPLEESSTFIHTYYRWATSKKKGLHGLATTSANGTVCKRRRGLALTDGQRGHGASHTDDGINDLTRLLSHRDLAPEDDNLPPILTCCRKGTASLEVKTASAKP